MTESKPAIFLSAASADLGKWRDFLHDCFEAFGLHVFTQAKTFGEPSGTVSELIHQQIDQSSFVVHLAGTAYGNEPEGKPFPTCPRFRCSFTQYEYYYAVLRKKPVIAFVCEKGFPYRRFKEVGRGKAPQADRVRRRKLQQAHCARLLSGDFKGTPLEHMDRRVTHSAVGDARDLFRKLCGAMQTIHANHNATLAAALAGAQSAMMVQESLRQLPAVPRGFVGRTGALAKLRKLRRTGTAAICGLKGTGGIGKTALAIVLAHEWLADFPDAQIILDGRATKGSPAAAADLLAQVLHLFHPTARLPEELDALHKLYQQTLQNKRVLILLDDARDAQQATPLLPPQGCGLIVTSRHSFMLGLTTPFSLGVLTEPEGVQLLRKHCPALGAADAKAIARRCGYLPLALRLAGSHLALDAANRAGHPDIAGYIAQLTSGPLKTLDADAPDAGELAITETLRISEETLPPELRDRWRKLSIFPAPFDASAAMAITGADAAALQSLLRRSLIEADDKRYRLHDLAAEYAREKLDADALTSLRLEHAWYYRAVLAEAQRLYLCGGAGITAGLAFFDAERAQIEAAHVWLLTAPADGPLRNQRDKLLIAYPNAGVYVLNLRQHAREQIAWLEASLAAARRIGHRAAEGASLGNLGNACARLGDARKAIEFHQQALAISREIGNRRGEGSALGNLGNDWAELGDARKAIEFYQQHRVIAREIGDRREEGIALGNLGVAWGELGNTQKATEFCEQQLVIAREIGDRRGEGYTLGNLGNAWASLGDTRKAIEFYEQYLAIACEIGDRRGEGIALGSLGSAWADLGDARKAIEFYEQRLIIGREIGDRSGEGNALGNLGIAWKNLGDARKAIGFYEQQQVIVREIGDRRGEAAALFNSALAYESLSKLTEALPLAQQAEAIFTAIESPHAEMARQLAARLRQAVSGSS